MSKYGNRDKQPWEFVPSYGTEARVFQCAEKEAEFVFIIIQTKEVNAVGGKNVTGNFLP